jgi:MSHA pilin protein MshC
MQQTNSNQTATGNFCHQIVFDVVEGVNLYGVPDRVDCDNMSFPTPIKNWVPDATGHMVDSNYQISFNLDGLTNPKRVGFDWMGRPTFDCAGGCEINVISSVETLKVYIEPEGYINVFTELH